MIVYKSALELVQHLQSQTQQIHFVPTMGALHEGHMSLIDKANEAGGLTICSIFVNPTQFNNASDLQHYPRTIEMDIERLISHQCDVLYLPNVDDIYPNGTEYALDIDISQHNSILEGSFRPGHFEGVVKVVDRFLEIIKPNAIYLGEKDLQQIKVITHLVELKHPHIEIVPCPTLRETDGLAKSSRNQRLSIEERQIAPLIFKTLSDIIQQKNIKPFSELQKTAIDNLTDAGFKVDYLTLVDVEEWKEIDDFSQNKMSLLIAAYIGEVRLIDNILF